MNERPLIHVSYFTRCGDSSLLLFSCFTRQWCNCRYCIHDRHRFIVLEFSPYLEYEYNKRFYLPNPFSSHVLPNTRRVCKYCTCSLTEFYRRRSGFRKSFSRMFLQSLLFVSVDRTNSVHFLPPPIFPYLWLIIEECSVCCC